MDIERDLTIDFTNGRSIMLTYHIMTALRSAETLMAGGGEDRSNEEVDNIAVTFLAESILWWDLEDEEGPVPLIPAEIVRRLSDEVLVIVAHELSEDFKEEARLRGKDPDQPEIPSNGNGVH